MFRISNKVLGVADAAGPGIITRCLTTVLPITTAPHPGSPSPSQQSANVKGLNSQKTEKKKLLIKPLFLCHFHYSSSLLGHLSSVHTL